MNENKELFEEIKQYIENVNNSIENVIEDVRKQENTIEFINLLEGISYCIEGINSLCIIENIELKNIVSYKEKFNQNLQEIIEALENKDVYLVADILEYEVMELISDLNNDIKNINLV